MCCKIVRFFFFQAEDGIRDKLVTGVQTCALPIYAQVSQEWLQIRDSLVIPVHRRGKSLDEQMESEWIYFGIHGDPDSCAAAELRSEERRVGKECRSRWSPYH